MCLCTFANIPVPFGAKHELFKQKSSQLIRSRPHIIHNVLLQYITDRVNSILARWIPYLSFPCLDQGWQHTHTHMRTRTHTGDDSHVFCWQGMAHVVRALCYICVIFYIAPHLARWQHLIISNHSNTSLYFLHSFIHILNNDLQVSEKTLASTKSVSEFLYSFLCLFV